MQKDDTDNWATPGSEAWNKRAASTKGSAISLMKVHRVMIERNNNWRRRREERRKGWVKARRRET